MQPRRSLDRGTRSAARNAITALCYRVRWSKSDLLPTPSDLWIHQGPEVGAYPSLEIGGFPEGLASD